MDEHVFWREKLKQLADGLGRGGIRLIAEKIDKSPTYISRMISDPKTSQHRIVTHETCYLLTKAFPGWLSDGAKNQAESESFAVLSAVESPKVVYEVRPKTKRQRAVDSLLETVEKINDDGLSRLLERAEMLSESHPAAAKQTHK